MYTPRRTLVHLPLTPSTFYDLFGFFRFAFNTFSRFAPLRSKKIDNNRFNLGKPVKSFFNLKWIKKKVFASNRLIELSQTIYYYMYNNLYFLLWSYYEQYNIHFMICKKKNHFYAVTKNIVK